MIAIGGYVRAAVVAGLILSWPFLRVGKRCQVFADPLRTCLPDVRPGADRPHRGHSPGRHLTRELLSSLRLQRVIARSAGCSRPGRHARRHLEERMITISSS
jgi:hypothetical protein